MIYVWDEISGEVKETSDACPVTCNYPLDDGEWEHRHMLDLPDRTRIVIESSGRHTAVLVTTPRHDAPLKPRYLLGATGTVMDKRVTKVSVRFDDSISDPYRKWAGKIAGCSPSWLEKVN